MTLITLKLLYGLANPFFNTISSNLEPGRLERPTMNTNRLFENVSLGRRIVTTFNNVIKWSLMPHTVLFKGG